MIKEYIIENPTPKALFYWNLLEKYENFHFKTKEDETELLMHISNLANEIDPGLNDFFFRTWLIQSLCGCITFER